MATLDELSAALVNADRAGDTDAARMLAAEITKMRVPPAQTQMLPDTDPMGNPTGAMVSAPAGQGMPYGEQMRNVGNFLDKGARMAANGATFGLADKAAGGVDYLTGNAPSYDAGVKAQRAQTQAVRDSAPVAAALAEATGGLAGGAGLVKGGVTLAGRMGPSLLARTLGYGAEGGAYGAAHGAGNTYSDSLLDYAKNTGKGAAFGSAFGAALPAAGSVANALYRTGAAFLGPRVADAGRGASALLRGAAQADESGLRNLSQLGGEAMLPDAGPAMLGLAQGAGTGTGPGRSALVNALTERDRGTGGRLAQALDQNLGPSPIPSRIEAGLSGDRAYVGQQYEPVINNASATDTSALAQQLEASAVNLRGPAQRAVRQVREMLDVPGAPGNLDPHPRALLSTRQAIDGMLATETNPQVVRELELARRAVDTELARAAPGIKDVDAQFSELSRQSEGLQRGAQLYDTGKTAVRPQELTQQLQQSAAPQGNQIGPSAASFRMRQGSRAEIDRLVGTNVNDLNTLERKLGTPQDWNYQKFGMVHGEGPRDAVVQALGNNRTYRDTFQKVVQNSQSAQRTESARAMDGAAGGNIPNDITATSLSLKAINAIAKLISGQSNATTKDEVGRILAEHGPAAQRMALELLSSAQTTGSNARSVASALSSPLWIGAVSPAASRR
jgi:hypothetical protein